MTRTLAQQVPVEVALLGLFELLLSFLLIYAALLTPVGAGILTDALFGNGTVVAAIMTVTMVSIAAVFGLYRPRVCLEADNLVRYLTTAGLCAFPVLLLAAGSLSLGFTLREALGVASILIVWLIAIFLSRAAFRLIVGKQWLTRRVLVLGDADRAARLVARLRMGPGRPFDARLVATGAPVPTLDSLREQRIWAVIEAREGRAGPHGPSPTELERKGIRMFDEARFSEQQFGRLELDLLDAVTLRPAIARNNAWQARARTRIFDVLGSLLLLVLTLPVMLVTALLVRLDSPGPVFYRQLRSGLNGRAFMLIKFRSMVVEAEACGTAQWAQSRDPRITRVGAWIRPLRIDELPQLLNVLRGEMSLIGPRPERPVFVEQLAQVIAHYHERSAVKPGITGWAQVNFPYGASVEDAREKLAYDLYYVKNRSLILDLLILVSTVRVVLFREGAR